MESSCHVGLQDGSFYSNLGEWKKTLKNVSSMRSIGQNIAAL